MGELGVARGGQFGVGTIEQRIDDQALPVADHEIERKDKLVRQFKKANLTDGSYDTTRLKVLVEHLLKEWIHLRHLDDNTSQPKSKKKVVRD